MTTLSIDIETYSSVDLKKCGVYKYVESPDFEILLIAYQYDDADIRLLDMTNELSWSERESEAYEDLLKDICNVSIVKLAYNAQFEITCLSKHLGVKLDPAQWSCTMVKAAMLGLPFGLGFVADVLNLPVQKYIGGAHIKYFCCPCKPTKVNGGRTRNFPHHDPEKWEQFKEYCKIDVLTERAIGKKIDFFEIPEFEKPMWAIDQRINSGGVMIDRQLVENAIRLAKEYTDKLIAEVIEITGVDNPKSVQQLKGWLEEEMEEEIENLQAGSMPDLLQRAGEGKAKRVLQIRQQISRSSIKKYQSMLNHAGADDRIRGLFQYYGANRTGRWAGRGVQVQNLVKNDMKELDLARQIVKEGDLDTLELFFSNVSRVLSQLVRTAFIPAPGKKFLISDFSAIEARVIAWLAGEKWRLDVFNSHGKIYEASGAAMFKMKIEDIKKGSMQRDAAKVAELALGYQGAVGAMSSMIATEKRRAYDKGKTFDYDPSEDEMKEVVRLWRLASPNIVKLWYDTNDAAITAVETGQKVPCGKVAYHVEKNVLFCTLPSGRKLAYMRPKIVEGKYGPQIEYQGMNQTSKKWERMRAYGGLLVENNTQAIARDLLAEKIRTLQNLGIVLHIHDEIVIEGPADDEIEDIDEIMSEPVSWAPGLPLKGDGFETYYYKKDD